MTQDLEGRVAFRVRGRVQGVGFRWFTTRLAERLGVVGWVRNRADGDVEGEAQAARETLTEFVSGLEAGPRWSRVEAVEITESVSTEAGEERFTVL